jgi:hypothetical protein
MHLIIFFLLRVSDVSRKYAVICSQDKPAMNEQTLSIGGIYFQ